MNEILTIQVRLPDPMHLAANCVNECFINYNSVEDSIRRLIVDNIRELPVEVSEEYKKVYNETIYKLKNNKQ